MDDITKKTTEIKSLANNINTLLKENKLQNKKIIRDKLSTINTLCIELESERRQLECDAIRGEKFDNAKDEFIKKIQVAVKKYTNITPKVRVCMPSPLQIDLEEIDKDFADIEYSFGKDVPEFPAFHFEKNIIYEGDKIEIIYLIEPSPYY